MGVDQAGNSLEKEALFVPIHTDLLSKIGRSCGPNQIVSKTLKLFHVETVALLPTELNVVG